MTGNPTPLVALAFVTTSILCSSVSPVAFPPTQEVTAATLDGEAMYPFPSNAVWQQVLALASELGFKTETKNDKYRVLVTQWRRYETRVLPEPATLGIGATDMAHRIQLHIAVAAGREPARVAVGSIVELSRQLPGRSTVRVYGYRPPAIDKWFLELLSARLGGRYERLAATSTGRTEQALRLMPPGSSDPCLSPTPDRGVSSEKSAPMTISGVQSPVKISDVQPLFPAQGYQSGEGKILVIGSLTEHGTMTNLSVPKSSTALVHYEQAAASAVRLWRFQPAIVGGCPIAIVMTVIVNFRLQ